MYIYAYKYKQYKYKIKIKIGKKKQYTSINENVFVSPVFTCNSVCCNLAISRSTSKATFVFITEVCTSSGNSTTGWGEGVRGEDGAISTGRGSVTRGLKVAPWELPLSSLCRKSNSLNALCNYSNSTSLSLTLDCETAVNLYRLRTRIFSFAHASLHVCIKLCILRNIYILLLQ